MEECLGINIIGGEAKDFLRQINYIRPILPVGFFLYLVEETLDTPLYTFTGHDGGMLIPAMVVRPVE